MSHTSRRRFSGSRGVTACVTLIALAACSGASDDASGPVSDTSDEVAATTTAAPQEPAAEPEQTTSTTAAPEAEPFDISQVESSVVKILAEGTFADPDTRLVFEGSGVGSGVVISADGLVVTNNHVVTGAALLEVAVPGRGTVNARLLGASECLDLAVIDLEGDGYEAREFSDLEPRTGLRIFAAGYPAVDEGSFDEVDYTLTAGIIASTSASGESSWSSVDMVLEHDAMILGGNSGGPLLYEDGSIAGINYAGRSDIDKNYAIAASEVSAVLDRLIAGEHVDSIGVNGTAIYDYEYGIPGIWVASVRPGSPADAVGIIPGDLITSMQDIPIAEDGTYQAYCDVIRTQGPTATINIEVVRTTTGEVLSGQLNGRPIETGIASGGNLDDVALPESGDSDEYTEYQTVSDDEGLIFASVPTEWVEVDGSFNVDFGGPSVWAAPSIEGFQTTFDDPGMTFDVSADGTKTIDSIVNDLNIALNPICEDLGAEPYDDGLYSGVSGFWADCGGTSTAVVAVVAEPASGAFQVRVVVQVVSERDLAAADEIFASFIVVE